MFTSPEDVGESFADRCGESDSSDSQRSSERLEAFHEAEKHFGSVRP